MMKRALILGGSSGIGWATVEKLCQHGFEVDLIHRDRRQQVQELEERIQALKSTKAQVNAYNFDATSEKIVNENVEELYKINKSPYKLVLHAISRGNLKKFYSESGSLTSTDIGLTQNAMATSLHFWVKALIENNLLSKGSRIVGLTSEGNKRAWPGYGAVAVAKSSLETICHYLAVELAPVGINVNVLQAGITLTPSLRLIPGSEDLIIDSERRNPSGRLTTPGDVADMIYLLTLPESDWVNGSTIHVDGGEHLL